MRSSLRTNNRNFEGRSSTKSAQVFLVSPESAAAAALTGAIIDPRTRARPILPSKCLPSSGSMTPWCCRLRTGPKPLYLPWTEHRRTRPRRTAPMWSKAGLPSRSAQDHDDHIQLPGSRLKYRSISERRRVRPSKIDPHFQEGGWRTNRPVSTIIIVREPVRQGSKPGTRCHLPHVPRVKAVIAKSFERTTREPYQLRILPLTFSRTRTNPMYWNAGNELEESPGSLRPCRWARNWRS